MYSKDAQKEEFKYWLAQPTSQRKPQYQQDWAKEHNIDKATLSRWKNDPDFMNEVRKLRKEPLQERLGEIIKKLGDKAEAGDVRAIELALKYTDEHIERMEIGSKQNSIDYVGPEFWNFMSDRLADHLNISKSSVKKAIDNVLASIATYNKLTGRR